MKVLICKNTITKDPVTPEEWKLIRELMLMWRENSKNGKESKSKL